MLISKPGRKYKDEVYACVLEQWGLFKPLTGHVSMHIQLTPPNKVKRDLDNYFKGLFDALTYSSVWLDDEQVKHLNAHMLRPAKPGQVVIHFTELPI